MASPRRAVPSTVIYLDNNATTRPSAAVVAAVHSALTEYWQNPSSIHRPGQAARQQVELARRDAAELLGVSAREVTFTSGGTESIHLAIRGVAATVSKPVVVSTRVEHSAVRDVLEDFSRQGVEVRWAPVDAAGVVDVERLGPLLEGATLASIQWANNETGAVQPIEQIYALCRARAVTFHCDSTQWIGKEPAPSSLPCDLLTFSPHKFHGPKGVGVLWARRGVGIRPVVGGSQELGRRGGTENVPGIAGAGVACREARAFLADPTARERLGALRDRFERVVLAALPDAVVNAATAKRLWNTTNIAFPRLEAEAILLLLSERGVCASAGAACSSGSLDPSPVLLAMGVPPELAHGSVRFSLSRETTGAEVEEAAAIVIDCLRRLRGSMPGA